MSTFVSGLGLYCSPLAGTLLACQTSPDDGSSDIDTFPAHAIGVNAISWSPAMSPGSLTNPGSQPQQPQQQQGQQGQAGQGQQGQQYQRKFASAGCDGVVRIWNYK